MTKFTALVGVCALAIGGQALAGFDELITFDEVPLGTNADGMMILNALFSFQVEDRGSGATVSGGPGLTPYTSDPGIEGPTFGRLGVQFSQPIRAFGFGFALQSIGYVPDAVCVDIYDPMGGYLTTLKSDADSFQQRGEIEFSAGELTAGGFDCIGSIEVTFAQFQTFPGVAGGVGIDRFLFDNLGYDFCDVSPVPLPTPALMGAAGLLAVGAVRRRR